MTRRADTPTESSSPPELRAAVTDERDHFSSTLAGIRRSTSTQHAIAARSYWHPNGFAKLVLDVDPLVGELRLHIWPDNPHDEDIHGHAWAYASVVLAGELTEIPYRETEPAEGQAMWRHAYRRVGHRRFEFGDVVPVHLARTGDLRRHALGALSGGGSEHIHRFYASRTPAVTLLRVGPFVAHISPVYRSTPEPPPITTPRPLTSTDVRHWIDFVAQIVVC